MAASSAARLRALNLFADGINVPDVVVDVHPISLYCLLAYSHVLFGNVRWIVLRICIYPQTGTEILVRKLRDISIQLHDRHESAS
jgi:hypothetical protein